MKKLHVRKLGGGSYRVGIGPSTPGLREVTGRDGRKHLKAGRYPAKREQVVTVTASGKREALRKGKALWWETFQN